MVNSVVWTDEETKFLKAVLRWNNTSEDSGGGSLNGGRTATSSSSTTTTTTTTKSTPETTAAAAAEKKRQQQQQQQRQQQQQKKHPTGEFRILVVGAKGVGKTSILTRFGRGDFPGEDQPPDPAYTRGCRRPVSISMFNTSSSGDKEDSSSSSSTTTTYIIDALELPSAHLSAMDSAALPLHLEQALNITEAAVLVYDVRDVHSLSLAVSVGEFLLRRLQHGHGHGHGAGRLRREYGLMLVGNKIDEDETGDKKRVISWAEGAKAAAGLSALGSSGGGNGGVCSFVEVSAKTGEGVDGVFPRLGRDVVRLRWRGQQRREREQAEMMGKESMLPPGEKNLKVKKRRVGLWKALTHPFSRQQRETRAY